MYMVFYTESVIYTVSCQVIQVFYTLFFLFYSSVNPTYLILLFRLLDIKSMQTICFATWTYNFLFHLL